MVITELPQAYNQGVLPACTAFAVAGMANYRLKQLGIADNIDPVKLFQETEGTVGAANFPQIMEFGLQKGFLSDSGKRYKIKDCKFVTPTPSAIKEAFNQSGLLLIEYLLHDGDPFSNRIVNGELSRQPWDTHGLLIRGIDEENFKYLVRNSWGKEWGINGDFLIPFSLMREPDLSRVIYFNF